VPDLAAAYRQCQRLARRAASNFYFSFVLLPRDKRLAMCALYAYLRRVDDLADDEACDEATKFKALTQLRSDVTAAQTGYTTDPVLVALADTTRRFSVPMEYLTAPIDGVEMDLRGTKYQTFTELEQYCYRVASAVGLACIHIWGFDGSAAIGPARDCGIAFQLTNILRDLREDAARNRIYLPQEDFERCGYPAEELSRGVADDRFLRLMRFEVARARYFFQSAAHLDQHLAPDGRRVFRAMTAAYRHLLEKIARHPVDVLHRRISLNTIEKLRLFFGAIFTPPAT
jgi:15-cis-phytoene synthase